MPRHRSRSRSPVRRSKHYDDPRDRRHERRSPAPSGLLVRNISLSARPEDLRIPFERYGPIKDVYLPKNYYTGEPRGFGFVKFRYPEDAAEAKSQLNHTLIGGREIRIVFAEENRKTPQEMRRVTRVSSRGSYRRRSSSWSPKRRYHSDSRSPSPARHESRGHGARDDYYSPHRSRSISRSVSPRDDRDRKHRERSPRHSVSVSRSPSPRGEKLNRPSRHSLSPAGNGRTDYAPARTSKSPRRNSRTPASPR
ncbi:serine/arginine-rich splicing factor 33 [Dorcoceras hygrometricum]|uniref:Serine/arginine-rich splicing factor 33 n=1 Tax=Dorcoceras hygrometricum TaxID=472368 RepID=A0A2Z7APE0_9LAMI|nr:serine/arginine-rich splicing factor 33 [Dorcoceras hygrometricum]